MILLTDYLSLYAFSQILTRNLVYIYQFILLFVFFDNEASTKYFKKVDYKTQRFLPISLTKEIQI
jgi:hypothetical protein